MDVRDKAARLVTGAHMAAEALAEMGAPDAQILLGTGLTEGLIDAIAGELGVISQHDTWLGSGRPGRPESPYTIVSVRWTHRGVEVRAQGSRPATTEEVRDRALIPGAPHHIATPDELRAAGVL